MNLGLSGNDTNTSWVQIMEQNKNKYNVIMHALVIG